MIPKLIIGFMLCVATLSWLTVSSCADQLLFYDLHMGRETAHEEVVTRLRASRIVLVGEHHTEMRHHRIQLGVIQMLHESGASVVIGMEMFRVDTQAELDRWVSGEMAPDAFKPIFYDNWNFDWDLYRGILAYARDKKIPIVGLNVPRNITRQVARQGFQSLSAEQKAELSDITCRVDKEYMAYIRKAFGSHAHGSLDFTHFCEAQLVWDNAMTVNALAYLKDKPDMVMVVLAGTGHVRKQAIPTQISKRGEHPLIVILPEVSGHIEKEMVDRRDADYLVLDPS
jgi:uncharacterized iron-regulated protein